MHEGSEDSRCNGPVSKLGTSQNASYKRYYSGKEGPGSSVGIATAYGLDGPGSNPGGDEIFRTCPDQT